MSQPLRDSRSKKTHFQLQDMAPKSNVAKNAPQYLNRELQFLAFNRRVLAQAEDTAIPLLERVRFVAIVSSNLDEFFEIRVAGLKEQLKLGAGIGGADGLSVADTLTAVTREAHALVDEQYRVFNSALMPRLAAEGIRFLRRAQRRRAQAAWIKQYFMNEMLPMLTPISLDPSHPFPKVFNKSLNFAVELSGRDAFGRVSLGPAGSVAIVQAPRALPRLVRLPPEIADGEHDFVFLTSILRAHVGELFAGMGVLGCHQFRVTRNSDLFVDDEEVKDLRLALQGELPQRHFGNAVRLEITRSCGAAMAAFLRDQFSLDARDVYQVDGPVNLVRLMSLPDLVDRPDLKFAPFAAGLPAPLQALEKAMLPALKKDKKSDKKKALHGKAKTEEKSDDLFSVLRKHDVLLHHPFQSFMPVIAFIERAARDPDVLAIKQTVYRTGTDSLIMEALIEGARRGKQVTVVVELMARFDEEANLNWAERLEEVGAHVVYGVVGHKTHAKMALIVRREARGTKGETAKGVTRLARYVHLGTGNYHARTAALYTDFGLLTADATICADVAHIFVQLTGLGKASKLNRLWQAPFTLHLNVLAAIKNETAAAKAGKKAVIVAKMNSLVDPLVISALYRASCAGVRINLIVRGICTLRPGVAGLSENIRVISIVGRFLEHSRIFYFRNGGAADVMLSSADWMERNFFRRVEIAIPVTDRVLKARVINEGLKPYLADNVDAWEMDADGTYTRVAPPQERRERYAAQSRLVRRLGGEFT